MKLFRAVLPCMLGLALLGSDASGSRRKVAAVGADTASGPSANGRGQHLRGATQARTPLKKKTGKPISKPALALQGSAAQAGAAADAFASARRPDLTTPEAQALIELATQKIGMAAVGRLPPYAEMEHYNTILVGIAAQAQDPSVKKLLADFNGVDAYMKFLSNPNRPISIPKKSKKFKADIYADETGVSKIVLAAEPAKPGDAGLVELVEIGGKEYLVTGQPIRLDGLPPGWQSLDIKRLGKRVVRRHVN